MMILIIINGRGQKFQVTGQFQIATIVEVMYYKIMFLKG
jgi:hypothetical protein